MRWLILPFCLILSTCGSEGRFVLEPALDASSSAGLGTPLHRSGTRLKIRWATPAAGDPTVRFPIEVVDTTIGRECEIERDRPCLPLEDEHVLPDELAFIDGERQGPALMVDAHLCESWDPLPRAERLWSVHYVRDEDSGRELVLDAPRWVTRAFVPEGGGCVFGWEPTNELRCVRPFVPADLRHPVTTRRTILGTPGGDGSGLLVSVADDGAILPLVDGYPPRSAYVDTRNDIECPIDADECVPRLYDRFRGSKLKGTALRFPSSLIGTGRIVVRVRTLPDGRHVPISLHDTVLRRDCTASRTEDGTWRCVVSLPSSCVLTEVSTDGHEVATPEMRPCTEPGGCCHGGPVWIPRRPAERATRFGYNSHGALDAVPGRAVRLSESSRMADHVQMYQPQIVVPVHDVTAIDAEVFAELHVTQDL